MLNHRSCRSCLKCEHGNYCKQLWCTTSRWAVKFIPILDTIYYFKQLDDKKLIEKLLDKIEEEELVYEEQVVSYFIEYGFFFTYLDNRIPKEYKEDSMNSIAHAVPEGITTLEFVHYYIEQYRALIQQIPKVRYPIGGYSRGNIY